MRCRLLGRPALEGPFLARPKGSRRSRAARTRAFCAIAALALAGCGAPAWDAASTDGRQAIIDETNLALTRGECNSALDRILPLYQSASTANDVRLITASAYGCHAHINLFGLIDSLISNSGQVATNGLWSVLSLHFPSTLVEDRVVEASGLASEALFSVITPGQVVLPEYMINTDTSNPGSLVAADRLTNANAYLLFVAMAGIGGTQSRYGNPDPTTGNKGNPLSWTTAAAVDEAGCAYASALVNFADALDVTADNLTGDLKDTIIQVRDTFVGELYQACEDGCQGAATFYGTNSGCGGSATSCATCPIELRSRTACLGAATDPSSCAAAGLVNFINSHPILGWQ
jgi:hypothetical protein